MVKLKKLLPIAVVSALALTSVSADKTEQTKNPVVAKFGDKNIYYQDVIERKSMIPQLASAPLEAVYQGLLQQMVAEMLIKEEVAKSKVESTPEYKERVQKAAENVKVQLFIEKKVDGLVTDEKLLEVFSKLKKEFKEQDEVDAQHILVENEAAANAILADLKNGKSFEELARTKSMDPSTKQRGGKLGYFTKDIASNTLGKEFAEAAFILKTGLHNKVKSKFGWHVIKINDKRKSKPPKFEQVAPQLRMLQSQKSLIEYIEGLMKDKGVKLFDTQGKEIAWDKKNAKNMAGAVSAGAK